MAGKTRTPRVSSTMTMHRHSVTLYGPLTTCCIRSTSDRFERGLAATEAAPWTPGAISAYLAIAADSGWQPSRVSE